MLSNLFPNFFGSKNGKSELSTGVNPGQLNGNDKQSLAFASQLSDTPTPESLNRLAQNVGGLEAQTLLLAEESKYKLKQGEVALANLDLRVKHSEQALKQAEKYKETMAKHGKNLLGHEIKSQAIQHNLDGYQQAMINAESRIDL